MPSITEAIRLVIEGDSSGAVKALGEVADGAAKTQGVFGKYGEGLNKAANWGAAGVVAGAAAVAKSVYDYQAAGSAIKELMRMTGDSAEQASTLAGQWDATGLSVGEGSVAMLKFSKNLQAVYDGSAKANPFGELGVSVTDANGQMRDSASVLADVQAAMSTLESPTQRTAVAVAMFGKSGDDLLNWLTKTPAELDALNKKLKEAGLVWSDEDMAAYRDAAAAQRDLQISLKGIEQTIARDVVPAMTPFVQVLGSTLHVMRPLAPVIVPATAALAVFVGVVKGAMIIQSTTTAVRGFYAAFKLTKMGTAITQMGNMRNLLPGLTTGLAGSAVQWGLVGIAAGGAAVAIMQAYDAAKKYQDALDELKTATEGAQATLDMNASKLDPAFVAQQQAQINRDSKVNTPWYYYLNPAYAFLEGASKLATGGTVKAQRGGTIVRAAEAGEDEDFVPASRRESYARSVLARSRFARQPDAGSGSVLVTGNTFIGTSRDAERTLTNIVSRRLGPQTARLGRGRMAMTANG